MKREAGFTMVELVVVVAIVGILVGLVALNIAGDIKGNRLKEATTQFYSDLKKCRVDALTRISDEMSRGYAFQFSNATSYRIFEFNDVNNDYNYGNVNAANTTAETRNPVTVTVPHGVQVSSTVTLTDPLFFDRRGWLRDATWASANGGTYIFSLAGVTTVRCVVLSTTRIRQGVWNGTNCN